MSQPKLYASCFCLSLAAPVLIIHLEHYVPLLMSTSSTVRYVPEQHVMGLTSFVQATLAYPQERIVRRLQSKAYVLASLLSKYAISQFVLRPLRYG